MEIFEEDYNWEFYLCSNSLIRGDLNDCIAEVKTEPKRLSSADISTEIKRRGSELEYETILSVISLHNQIIEESLLGGQSVMTDLCQFTPRITGLFANAATPFDIHMNKLTLDIVLAKKMREALNRVKTISLGAKPDVAGITLVTDTTNGLTDGSITVGEDIQIDGNRIKIAGDEAKTGVFFISADDETIVTKVTRRYTLNTPRSVLLRVPDLPDGLYTLRIVTEYSQENLLLKEPHALDYRYTLTVGNGGGTPY